jgi:CelD/BcsL family acetyltransferase involved in cellulose biosynthesis
MPPNKNDGLSANPEQNVAGDALHGDSVRMEVFECFTAIDSMQSQWDEFAESLGCDIFMTYDWCKIWWKYYGGDNPLRIFVFRHRGSIVGLLPTYLEKIYIGPVAVKVARIVGTTYVLAEVNPPVAGAYMHQVLAQWLDRIFSEFNPDIVCLGPLSGTYEKTDQINGECVNWSNERYKVEKKNTGVQTIFSLGTTWNEYFANLSKRDKSEINRNYRNIVKASGDENAQVVSEVISEAELSEALNSFVEMHILHWQQVGQSGHFNDWPKSREFHREVAEAQIKHDRLRLLKICVGSYCVGYEYTYNFSKTNFQYLNARASLAQFEHISVGRVVFSELVKKVLAEGITMINSMRGKYEYKLRMGGKLVSAHTILISRKGIIAGLRIRAFKSIVWFMHLCYYRVWFSRVAPKLPWRRRPFWNIWIKTNIFAY